MMKKEEIIRIEKLQPMHKIKFYQGRRLGSQDSIPNVKVTVGVRYDDGFVIIIGDLKHRYFHNLKEFEWGYEGSGSADLARSILWDFFNNKPTPSLYQDFKSKFVAKWKDKWEVTEKQIMEWLTKIDKKANNDNMMYQDASSDTQTNVNDRIYVKFKNVLKCKSQIRRIKMERTCNGCAALIRKNHKYAGCEFGVKTFTCGVNPEIAPIPLEECSKSKSYQALVILRKIKGGNFKCQN